MSGKYDDIINLPNPTSARHPRMARSDRAAQFAPFAALTGYDDAIIETGRLTNEMIELSEEMKEVLDQKQMLLADIIDQEPEIAITFFVPDKKKKGGMYKTVVGNLKQIDEYERQIQLTDGTKIHLSDIYDIDFAAWHKIMAEQD